MQIQPSIINIFEKAARKAGKVLIRDFGEIENLQIKSKNIGDFVTNTDLKVEKILIETLQYYYPKTTYISEERGKIDGNDEIIIIDPIDGTTNFIHGIPIVGIVISKVLNSEITDGVIYNPITNDFFWASKGKGAFLDEKPISVHKKTPLYKIVGINTSGASPELMKRLQPIFENHNHTRHFGANALEMAILAQGLMDIFIDLRGKIRIQDIAAGYLLVKEAGGLMLDENLNPLDSDLSYQTRLSFVSAATQEILDEIFTEIK